MSVDVIFSGRLGNNLFQYVLGRMIAEHHGFELNCTALDQPDLAFGERKLDVGPSASLPGLSRYFPNAPLHIPGRSFKSPVESYDIQIDRSWNGQRIDLAEVLRDSSPRRIRLSGFFQRFEYFEAYRAHIRQWLELAPLPCIDPPNSRDVVLNIRRGFDYWVLNWTLPVSYYHAALARLRDVRKVYVCGTGIDDQVRTALAEYDPVYYDASPIEHFAFMRNFHRIVLSNSTFAWWAAFLSDATEIVGPRYRTGDPLGFTGCGDIELTMEGERYQEIEIDGRARLAFPVTPELRAIRAGEDGVFAVSDRDGVSRRIGLSSEAAPWIPDLIQPGTAVSLAEIRRHCPTDQLNTVLTELIRSRVLSETPVVLDDSADA